MDRRDIERAALEHAMGQIDLDGLRRQMQFQQTNGKLVPAQDINHRHPCGSYTTPEMLALEAENVAMMRAGQGQIASIVASNVAREWSQRRGLSDEQVDAAAQMLTSATALHKRHHPRP